jgi:hypothetical protein
MVESFSVLYVGGDEEADRLTTLSAVARYTSKLTAFFFTLPSSIRFLNISMALFPDDDDDDSIDFDGAEEDMIPLVLRSRGCTLEGFSTYRADHLFVLQSEQLAHCRVLSCTEPIDSLDMVSFFRAVNMCSKLERLNRDRCTQILAGPDKSRSAE